MFVTRKSWDDKDGTHVRGLYLLVFHFGYSRRDRGNRELRCLLRSVKMVNDAGQVALKLPGEDKPIRVTLARRFGGRDLPLDVPTLQQAEKGIPTRIWNMLTPMPEKLSEQFWASSFEDDSVLEAYKEIRRWAKKNTQTLRMLHVPDELVQPTH